MEKNISSAIIESMSDGLIVFNFRGYITHMNPAASEILGLQPEKTRDRTYGQLFMDKAENDAFNDILFNGIQHRETRLYGEVPFMRNDGTRLDLAVTTSFLRSDSLETQDAGIVVVFKDITHFKALDRARQRVLDHLSHELRTPLSIILASSKRLTSPENAKALARIQRNLERLQDIQLEVEDIVKQRAFQERYNALPSVQQALDLVEMLAEEDPVYSEALHFLKGKIDHFFHITKSSVQDVKLGDYALQAVDSAKERSSHRQVVLITRVDENPTIKIDPEVLEKALIGLLKNAIENTPDQGEVEVSLTGGPGDIQLLIKDTGVGITRESQKQIFGGFYHSKDTDLYTTKKPFYFGAGGKGLDLLRLKIFAEVYGFQVEFTSTRCPHIPGEDDICPGVIERCPHVKDRKACFGSGGTCFTLTFKAAEQSGG